ncbi:hypothetical protein M0805_005422 [Coniferiporia weirii]|nr:hypothetical protein M0805_005422 [Coniferiporia weirii]
MAISSYDSPAHYSASAVAHYLQNGPQRPRFSCSDGSFFAVVFPAASRTARISADAGPCHMNRLYMKFVRRAWKRVTRATHKPERASVLPDGFVLINARLNSRRRSVLFT